MILSPNGREKLLYISIVYIERDNQEYWNIVVNELTSWMVKWMQDFS